MYQAEISECQALIKELQSDDFNNEKIGGFVENFIKLYFYCEDWVKILKEIGFDTDRGKCDELDSFILNSNIVPRIGEKIVLCRNPFDTEFQTEFSKEELDLINEVVYGTYLISDIMYSGEFVSANDSYPVINNLVNVYIEKISNKYEQFSQTQDSGSEYKKHSQ